jgi:glycosyltransferase involved in cell wall biosynthesis
VVVSFRLGGTDGVAIEVTKWINALTMLGHRVVTVAGEGTADVLLPGLTMHADVPPSLAQLHDAFSGADLVIVENIASLPLNVAARDVLYLALQGRVALFHHHDLAWQRPHLAHLEAPRDAPEWHHVTINELSRRELAERGIDAVTIMNSFDCDPALGRRGIARESVNAADDRLVVMPTRALARKNVGGALQLCEEIQATLWLLGPAEDGYDATLASLLDASTVEIRRGLRSDLNIHDAYAASDLVVMPSTWEGFGNPVLESVTHRRALALYPYPVAREIESFGFEFFNLDDAAHITAFLDHEDTGLFERNLAIAREHFNVAMLPERLDALLASIGLA